MQYAIDHWNFPDSSSSTRKGSAHICSMLRKIIMSGNCTPDEPLNIRNLADILHVSATPVREALIRLCAEGIVISLPKQGFFIRRFKASELIEHYELALVVLAYSIGKTPPGFGAHFPRLSDDFRIPASDLSPGSVERTAHDLAEFVDKLFVRIVVLSDNTRMRDAVYRFLAHTHYARELAFLRAPSMNGIVQNVAALSAALEVGQKAEATNFLVRHFETEILSCGIRRVPSKISFLRIMPMIAQARPALEPVGRMGSRGV